MKISRAWRLLSVLLLLVSASNCARTQAIPGQKAPFAAPDLFTYDRTQPLAPTEAIYEERADYKAYKLTYASANGQRVPAFFVLPTKPAAAKAPCIVMMHGLGQDKKALAMLWGTFAKDGYAVLAIDALYHGERAPKAPVELFGKDIAATKELLIQTVIDLRRGMDYLETRKEMNSKKIGYVGFSMGGILGTILSAVDTRVQAPVLALAGGNWKKMAELSTLGPAVKARQESSTSSIDWQPLDAVDPIHFVGKIAPRPTLFINGDNDTVVPVACAKELQDTAGAGKEIMTYKGGHVPAGAEFIKVLTRMTQWLNSHLKETAH